MNFFSFNFLYYPFKKILLKASLGCMGKYSFEKNKEQDEE